MKQRWLINLVLLIAVVVLAMLMRSEINAGRSVPTLTDLEAKNLYRIRIARDGDPTIVLAQDLLGWKMEEPMQVDADDARVQKLLEILDTPVIRSFPEASAALDELKLAPPRLKLQLDSEVLSFGDIDPLGQSRYVAAAGLVHLISDRFYHLLIAPPIDYVSLKLLPRDFNPVFGRLDGIPLTTASVTGLNEVIAERVETLAEDPSGVQAALKMDDGTTLRFIVSESRRRWARLDQGLLYVLTEPPELELDPNAVDPTPPEPVAASPMPAAAPVVMPTEEPMIPDTMIPDTMIQMSPDEIIVDTFGPVPTQRVPYAPPGDPNRIIPGDARLSEPPVFKLTPDGREIPLSPEVPSPPQRLPQSESANPFGFGVDPFAPNPPAGTVQEPAAPY
ncbi:hypothetical protein G3480_00345 [Thiorhodococcus mannitoliphagus]|uniref:DUF4340 domain-containing protein n=1 Tax=Thiorhodococcus mannitoliphagus TaxID=329406 RepID=A0A6P1DSV3_9GAMM|nr:DUF4340 domain-containing protein [Thiorhodococcus mannitoliphagus]NEX18785.1 hypothetical protein [Thiorhodococcus mannitoliphagus]